jgi:hypothetical protein
MHDFYDAFHNWRLANLTHSDNPGKGKYNYHLKELRKFTHNKHQKLNFNEFEPSLFNPINEKYVWFKSAEKEFGEIITKEDPPDDLGGYEPDFNNSFSLIIQPLLFLNHPLLR